MANIKSKIKKFAESALQYANSKYLVNLDFSPDSLSKLEVLLFVEKNLIDEKVSDDFDIHKQSRLWGIYLGEVLRKNIGGYWEVQDNDLALRVYGNNLKPLSFIYDRLQGLSSTNVHTYYLKEIQKIKESEAIIEGDQLDTTLTLAIEKVQKLEKTSDPRTTLDEIREQNEKIELTPSPNYHEDSENKKQGRGSGKQKSEVEKYIVGALIALTCFVVVLVGISAISKIQSANRAPRITPLSALPPTWTPSLNNNYDGTGLLNLVPKLDEIDSDFELYSETGPEKNDEYIGYTVLYSVNDPKVGEILTVSYMIIDFFDDQRTSKAYDGLKEEKSFEASYHDTYAFEEIDLDESFIGNKAAVYGEVDLEASTYIFEVFANANGILIMTSCIILL